MRSSTGQSGQILLITLLVLSIALTVALSLIGRTTTDLNISSQVEESSRAFSAAEAGIEEALKLGATTPLVNTLSTGETYTVTPTTIGGTGSVFQFFHPVDPGEVATFWFVDHDATGNPTLSPTYTANPLQFCWSRIDPTIPAIEIVYYFIDNPAGNLRIARAAYDPDAARAGGNMFDNVSVVAGNCPGTTSDYNVNTPLNTLGIDVIGPIGPNTDILIMARVRPVYARSAIGVNPLGGETLALQGYQYESCGSTGTNITRCVNVYQQYKTSSGLFDFVLYSSGFSGGAGSIVQ